MVYEVVAGSIAPNTVHPVDKRLVCPLNVVSQKDKLGLVLDGRFINKDLAYPGDPL